MLSVDYKLFYSLVMLVFMRSLQKIFVVLVPLLLLYLWKVSNVTLQWFF